MSGEEAFPRRFEIALSGAALPGEWASHKDCVVLESDNEMGSNAAVVTLPG